MICLSIGQVSQAIRLAEDTLRWATIYLSYLSLIDIIRSSSRHHYDSRAQLSHSRNVRIIPGHEADEVFGTATNSQ